MLLLMIVVIGCAVAFFGQQRRRICSGQLPATLLVIVVIGCVVALFIGHQRRRICSGQPPATLLMIVVIGCRVALLLGSREGEYVPDSRQQRCDNMVVVVLVVGLRRRRICSGLPASNVAIRWSLLCLLLDCGGGEFVWDWLRASSFLLGCGGEEFVRDIPSATLS